MDETTRYLAKACLTWLALWFIFNAVLLVEGLIWLWLLRNLATSANHLWCRSLFGDKVLSTVLFIAVPPNVLYWLGPLVETYIYLFLGRRLGKGRYLLFAAGLLFWTYMLFAAGMRGWAHVSSYLP